MRVALTDQIDISNGAHILYVYNSLEDYIDNAAAFIATGLEQGQHVAVIDSLDQYRLIQAKLQGVVKEELLQRIHFKEQVEFYLQYGAVHAHAVIRNMEELLHPYLSNDISLRTWGRVFWKSQEDIYEQIISYEQHCDSAINDFGVLGVCIYDGKAISASIQNELLKSHEYFMTDTELVRSSLYGKPDRTGIFPSFSVHKEMQSEVDLYKQKLDFVHVVSHEVRNPLTVIKAYATMLLGDNLDGRSIEKLIAIKDYVDVIDNEITHIINTEQMLTTESLWSKAELVISPILDEVVSIMATKARTQNIDLQSSIALSDERLIGNAIGLKLIVSNLLGNAIKYSEEDHIVRLDAYSSNDVLTLVITDKGIGMSCDQVQKLFRKYEKINMEKSGQGIGLFMVKNIVDHFAGEIQIETALNKGTTVTVKLPLKCAAAGKHV
ncbi:MEDS domain-containing protein [Paenibacillus abyssi]|uniref:histidine kinase n=1 Tax=Paenibacillus abyssi TaxID=1340531 RepID=A0A917FW60_9BACL|nr:MEDS domain-containing protein [Paenibacillus abyssi]GGG06389.1 hypothetical protein GCM10010916_24160 [Paenibacillus abyssi]